MNDEKVYSLLSSSASCDVYRDFIPEGATLPAISFVDITHAFSRVLDGSKTNKFDTWRLSLVCENSTDMSALVNEIETIDNTSTDEFQRIFVIYKNSDPQSDVDQGFYRSTIDLKTYEG
jgi:hypothetical protein|tara:strand:- start:2156 stop:2512 length:357 start_codon:yes stop_codon:yes gene_type:complete